MQWTVAIGVDTHKASHRAVALDRCGGQLGVCAIEASEAGYAQLLSWASSLGAPAFGIEGAASYGAGLARFLAAHAQLVFEVERPSRRQRRRGKNDSLDALLAARQVVAGEGLSKLRGAGVRELLRVLLVERRGLEQARTACLNQLHALIVTAPPPLRARLADLERARVAVAAARLRHRACEDAEQAALVEVLRRLGARAQGLGREADAAELRVAQLVRTVAPGLLAECGVGPICAAQLIVSSGEPGRMRSEASFAALAGTSPVEASSGPITRHRLNRGGDRQLNCALHRIALTRKQFHAETAAYYERLLARGKSKREAMRCLKRMLARHFYRQLRALPCTAFAEGAST
jgi:transposase